MRTRHRSLAVFCVALLVVTARLTAASGQESTGAMQEPSWRDRLDDLDATADAVRRASLASLLERLEPREVPELLERCRRCSPQARLAVHAGLAGDGRTSAGLILSLADARDGVHEAAVRIIERIVQSLQVRRGLDGLESEAERRNPLVFATGSALRFDPRPEGPTSLLGVVLLLQGRGVLDRPLVLDPRAASRVVEARGDLRTGFAEAPADHVLAGLFGDHDLVRWRLPGMHWVGLSPSDAGDRPDDSLLGCLRERGVAWPRPLDQDELEPAERLSLERSILGWCARSLRGPAPDSERVLAVLSLASYGVPGLAASAGRALDSVPDGPATAAETATASLLRWTLASALACGDLTSHPESDARRLVGLLAASSPPSLRTIAMAALRRLPTSAVGAAVVELLRNPEDRARLDEAAALALLRWLADAGQQVSIDAGLGDGLARSFAGSPRIDLELLRIDLTRARGPEDLPRDLVDRCEAVASLPEVALSLARSCRPGLGEVIGRRLRDTGRTACRRIQGMMWLLDGRADLALGEQNTWSIEDGVWFLDRAGPSLAVSLSGAPERRVMLLAMVARRDAPISLRLRAGMQWGLSRAHDPDERGSKPMPAALVGLMRQAVETIDDPGTLVRFFRSLASVEAGEVLADALEKARAASQETDRLLRALDRVGYLLARDAPGSFFRLRMRLQRLLRALPEDSPLGKMLGALDEALFAYSSCEDLGRRTIGLEGSGVLFP